MECRALRQAGTAGVLSLLLATTVFTAIATAPVAAAPAMSVVATGLDHPKQPAVGPDGNVYIACSGHAGPTDPLLDDAPANHTGSIVKVSPTGDVTPFVSGLLSRFVENSDLGPSGLAFWRGALYLAQGENDPLNSPEGQLLSSPVLKIAMSGKARVFTSFNALPLNPAAGPDLDTNPFAVAVGNDNRLYVSDGGDNGVWAVEPDGDATMIVQFPGDPTVTGVAAVPFPFGRANGLDRHGRGPEKSAGIVVCLFGNGASGFAGGKVMLVTEHRQSTLVPSGVIDMPIAAAYSPSGHLYILQFATPATTPGPPFAPHSGAIWSIANNGTATKVLEGLNFPTGMAFAKSGDAYVTNAGITPAGELVRVTGLP